jgi:hypothetical protein
MSNAGREKLMREVRAAVRAKFAHYYEVMGIDPDAPPERVTALIAEAVKAERERCASRERRVIDLLIAAGHVTELQVAKARACAAEIDAIFVSQGEPT